VKWRDEGRKEKVGAAIFSSRVCLLKLCSLSVPPQKMPGPSLADRLSRRAFHLAVEWNEEFGNEIEIKEAYTEKSRQNCLRQIQK